VVLQDVYQEVHDFDFIRVTHTFPCLLVTDASAGREYKEKGAESNIKNGENG
jgi:hypothetical protein